MTIIEKNLKNNHNISEYTANFDGYRGRAFAKNIDNSLSYSANDYTSGISEKFELNGRNTHSQRIDFKGFTRDSFGIITTEINKIEGTFFEIKELLVRNDAYTYSTGLDQQKKDFTKKLINCIQDQHFESGIASLADNIVEEALKTDASRTKSVLNDIFVENFHKPSILIGLLQIVSRQPAKMINPEGFLMATASISHKNLEVRECAICCFENWVSPQSLNILENIKTTPKWLQDYVNVIIKNIKEELCLIS